MPSIKDLLDPTAVKAVESVATSKPESKQVAPKVAPRPPSKSNPVAPSKMLAGATVQTIVLKCEANWLGASCGTTITVVDRPVPEERAHLPRLRVCATCAKAMTAGKTGRVIARPALSLPGGPAVVVTNTKEAPVGQVNLSTMSPAEVGEAVTDAARQTIAEALPEKRKKAKAKKAKKDKAAKKAKRKERADLANLVLPGFTAKKVEVPDLDLSAIDSVDEVVPSDVRSPYNKVLYRTGQSTLDKDTTTWKVLAGIHQELANGAQPSPTKPKKAKKGKPQIAAHVDMTEQERIQTLRDTFGVDKKTARRMLAEIGA